MGLSDNGLLTPQSLKELRKFTALRYHPDKYPNENDKEVAKVEFITRMAQIEIIKAYKKWE